MTDYFDIELVWDEVDDPNLDHYDIVRYEYDSGSGLWDEAHLAGESKKPYFTDRKVPESYDPATGGYWYAIWAVDKQGRFSTNPAFIYKTSPPEVYAAPTTPTGLIAKRSEDYNGVEMFWNENPEPNIKGYVIYRALDYNPLIPANPVTWELIETTSSTKFTDRNYPLGYNVNVPTWRITYTTYKIAAYDKEGNISTPTTNTNIFELPAIQGLRYNLDYLSLMLRWQTPLQEDSIGVVLGLLKETYSSSWIIIGFAAAGTNQLYFDGPLLKGEEYDTTVALPKAQHTINDVDTSAASQPSTIYAANPGGGYFECQPSTLALYDSGHKLIVVGGPNAGIYTITSTSLIVGPPSRARVNVTEAIPSASTDGAVYTSSMVRIAGDHGSEYSPNDNIVITDSTGNDGIYTVYTVTVTAGGTKIVLWEQVPDSTIDGYVSNASTAILQPRKIRVIVPEYEEDTTAPYEPAIARLRKDPEYDRLFITWDRVQKEDDFYEYEIYLREDNYNPLPGETTRPWVLLDTTKNNNYPLNNIAQRPSAPIPSMADPNIYNTHQIITLLVNQIIINGDHTSKFIKDDIVEIRGNVTNAANQRYTVVSSSYGSGVTTITIAETIALGTSPYGYLGKPREIAIRIYAKDRAGNKSVFYAEGITEWRSYEYEGYDEFSPATYLVDPLTRYLPATSNVGSIYAQINTTSTPAGTVQITLSWTDAAQNAEFFDHYIVCAGVGVDAATALSGLNYYQFGIMDIPPGLVLTTTTSNQYTFWTPTPGGGDHIFVIILVKDKFGRIYWMPFTKQVL